MSAKKVETRYDQRFGMYVAVAPDRSFCTGFGKTPEEARARLELALALWFDSEGGPLFGSWKGDSPLRPE